MTVRAIVLGAGRGTRRLDERSGQPIALREVEPSRTALDWILHALRESGVTDVTYVGGYHIQKVIERYPSLSYRFHARWHDEGELAAWALAGAPGPCVVIRAGVVCVPDAVRALVGPRGVAVGRGSDGEAAGLVAVDAEHAPAAFDLARRLATADPAASLAEWIARAPEVGIEITDVALGGLAAPIEDQSAVRRTVFGGKGRTLEQVAPLVRGAVVLDRLRFLATEWRDDPARVLDRVTELFGDRSVIVRSSAHAEDGVDESLAGAFQSVLDVPAGSRERLSAAVDEVVASYERGGRHSHAADEVLVQPQVTGLAATGVLLTRDLETGAPYFVVNVERRSGRPDGVTGGGEAGIETVYVRREADASTLRPDVRDAVSLARELEALTGLDGLDVEFGIDRAGVMYLFQVRLLAAKGRRLELADEDLDAELDRIAEFLDSRMRPHPTLAGRTTVFGTMPDWNPAEMIGTTPRPLALSLYQRLIVDEAWATARAETGYRDVRPEPLVVSLGGRPYVDVRASLNSFLPSSLPEPIAEQWVDRCIDVLTADPRLHDKIEFEVAITCLTPSFDQDARRLRDAGLSAGEVDTFREALGALTDRILAGVGESAQRQRAAIAEMSRRRERWASQAAAGVPALARRAAALIRDCERFGTTSFSVLARYAFVAMSFLRAMRASGALPEEEYETVLRSVPTVASDLARDFVSHAARDLPTTTLLERYGHLRPSSYDITSPNYAQAAEVYLSGVRESDGHYPDVSIARAIFDRREASIGAALRDAGLSASPSDLLAFVLEAIPAREWAKFEFMKSVDRILEDVAALGRELGLSRDDMSFVPIDLVLRGATESASPALAAELVRAANHHRKRWSLTSAIRLPHVVRGAADVAAFELEEWSPNFISTRCVVAAPVLLDGAAPAEPLDGKIVLIRAADPGYDWIFGHRIAGLVTQFGGVASHMSIRAAEFGLPAAIGCGELIFARLQGAPLIELDCASRKVRALT